MTRRAKPDRAPPAAETRLQVVDLNRCRGYSQCCLLAPHGLLPHGEQVIGAATKYQIIVNPDDHVGLAARVDCMEGRR